jgi:hypothetical protein
VSEEAFQHPQTRSVVSDHGRCIIGERYLVRARLEELSNVLCDDRAMTNSRFGCAMNSSCLFGIRFESIAFGI